MNVGVLAAHPGDAETNVGGLIARFASEGHLVRVFVATVIGDVTLRSKRAIDSAYHLGADIEFLNFDSYGMAADLSHVQLAEDAIMNWGPHLLVSHRLVDSHQDHRACGHIARSVARFNQIELWDMDHSVPGGMVGAVSPTSFVNVSDFQTLKTEALSMHGASREVMSTVDFRGRYYGGMIGVEYAEGFTVQSKYIL